jgi:hypothetical protein
MVGNRYDPLLVGVLVGKMSIYQKYQKESRNSNY